MDERGRLDPCSVDVAEIGNTYLNSNKTNTLCLGFGDESLLGEHCKIFQKPKKCDRDEQSGAALLGPATRLAWTCRSCGCNAHNAMCNRHGSKRPTPTKEFDYANKYIDDSRAEIDAMYTDHFSLHGHEWLQKWPLVKQEAIAKSTRLDELRPNTVKNMVKREHQSTKPKKARCIQFYKNLATQAQFGPEFTSLQKAYCKLWHRHEMRSDGIRVTIGSAMNSKTLGDWMTRVLNDYSNPYFYERDGKAWDATMGPSHHALKMRAYAIMPQEFRRFVDQCYKVRGLGVYRDGSILQYEVEGTVKSGHNDTTLGNCIVNAMIAAEACHRLGLKCDIIVVGDDLLIIIEGDFDEHALAEEESALGIVPEYRKFDDVEDVSFISGHWVTLRRGGYIFAPKLGRLLARLHWTVTPPPPKTQDAYLRGVYSGIRATCHSLPVYSFLAPETQGSVKNVDQWYTEMYGTDALAYTRDDVIDWFQRKYHCSLAQIEALETELLDRTPRIVRSDFVDIIESVDLNDIGDRACVRDSAHIVTGHDGLATVRP